MEEDTFPDQFVDRIGKFPKSHSYDDDLGSSYRPRLESRMSICLPSKGFLNEPGDNNCFLNAAIQLLWHVNVFRRSFRLLEGHACVENACIFCSLKRIFYQLEGSDESALEADDMRLAMANAFIDERRFQLGRMDDAAECYENILTRLHFHTAWREPEDSCSTLHCIPHQKFALHVLEQTFCKCKATSEPKPFYQFVYYVAASALVEQAKICKQENRPVPLGQLLKQTAQFGDTRPCPDEKRCRYKGNNGNSTRIENTLLNRPDVVTLGIIWDTDSPSSSYIVDVMDCISESLFIVDMFDHVLDDEYKRLEMKLAGVVTYYGRHYTSFFYNVREQQWFFFDDAQVSQIGSAWENVKYKCERTRFQPLLIVFTNGSGSLVNVEKAPTATETVASTELLLNVQPIPSSKPQQTHRKNKHHRKHKKGRNASRSPSHSPDKTFSERTSSRSSNGSVSPTSPRRTLSAGDSNAGKRGGEGSTIKTSLESRYEKLNDDPNAGSYSRPPKSLMRGSASDGSIVEMANGEHDFVDAAQRKRSGSMKRSKVFNVFKSMNPYKSFKAKNGNTTIPIPVQNGNGRLTPDQELAPPPPSAPGTFADVGYTSPYNKRSQNKEVPPPPRSPQPGRHQQQHNGHSPSTGSSPNNQLKHLEMHKDNLGKTGHKHNKHQHNGHTVKHTHKSNHNGEVSENNSESMEFHNGSGDNENQEHFQDLLSRGDMNLKNAEFCEKKGDLLYALRLCSEATIAYRDASRVPGISDDLLQYVDNKRRQSFTKSQSLQRQVDTFLNDEGPPAVVDHNGQNMRNNGPTSGYSSMAEAALTNGDFDQSYPTSSAMEKDEYRTPSPPPYIQTREQEINDLVNLQNTNARQQAMDRLRQKPSPPQQQDWPSSSADSIRRASFDIVSPQQRRVALPPAPPRNVVPSYGQTIYGSKTLPHPQRRPIDNNHNGNVHQNNKHAQANGHDVEITDEILRNVPQTLRKPELPTPRNSENSGRGTTVFDDRTPENGRHVDVRETSVVTYFGAEQVSFSEKHEDVNNGTARNTDTVNSAGNTANYGAANSRSNTSEESLYPSFSATMRNLSTTNNDNTITSASSNPVSHDLPHTSLHATLRNNGAGRVSTGSFSKSDVADNKATERKKIRSIYDNVEGNNVVEQCDGNEGLLQQVKVKSQQAKIKNEKLPLTIYDDGVLDGGLNKGGKSSDEAKKAAPSARELIKRLNSVSRPSANATKISSDSSKTKPDSLPFSEKQTDLPTIITKSPQTPNKDVTKRFSQSLTLQPSQKEEELNTLQRLNKEGKISARCPKCKWRKVEAEGDFCQECRTDYLSTLKKKAAPSASAETTTGKKGPPVNKDTLEKLRKGGIKKFKCIQCGWKQVDSEGAYCSGCQSEYL